MRSFSAWDTPFCDAETIVYIDTLTGKYVRIASKDAVFGAYLGVNYWQCRFLALFGIVLFHKNRRVFLLMYVRVEKNRKTI